MPKMSNSNQQTTVKLIWYVLNFDLKTLTNENVTIAGAKPAICIIKNKLLLEIECKNLLHDDL